MKLRRYQKDISKDAVDILRKYGLVYLALQTRTGKTITAMEIVKQFAFSSVLFVTKKKAIDSIKGDYEHYKNDFKIQVINFESVHKIKEKFDVVIVDEAHSISAFPKPSKRAVELKKLVFNKPVIYLSATPSPESYSQLYHQFWISNKSPFNIYPNFYKWAKQYVTVKKKYVFNREINDYSDADITKIDKETKKLFITYTQKEAGFEFTIQEKILKLPLSESQIKAIEILKKDNVLMTKSGGAILADTAVKLQSKIHQICSGSCKDEEGRIHIINTNKAEFIKKQFQNKKIAIYYKFIGELMALKTVFENYTDNANEFQSSVDKVYLGQFVSSREGIRLDTAEAIIFYNIDFSFLSYEQAKNRIVSKERDNQAVLYWIFTNGGIEEKIYHIVKNKKSYTNYHFKRDYGIRKRSPGTTNKKTGTR